MHEKLNDAETQITMPESSPDPLCNYYLKEIGRAGMTGTVEEFLSKAAESPAKTYESVESFYEDNPDYNNDVDHNLTEAEKNSVRSYSGYRFNWINSVARGFWDYDKMGRKTPELEEEIKNTTRQIIGAIGKAPAPKEDFITYRGTNLDAFRSYGVNTLNDLVKMKGQFMLEQGFTSTALIRENSFADRQVNSMWIGSSDIEIRFRVPAGAKETIALFSDRLSYSPQQTEVLIDHNALSYVSNVEMADGRVVMDAVLVPKNVYDPNFSEN